MSITLKLKILLILKKNEKINIVLSLSMHHAIYL